MLSWTRVLWRTRFLLVVLARCWILFVVLAAFAAPALAETNLNAPATKPLSAATLAFLELKGIATQSPAYIRIFKEESELEIWKARAGGRFVHVKTYPICTWSGTLGPKITQGDHMAPEGFYGIGYEGMKPESNYHLAMNIGYPNALDRALGRSGAFIMVHGDCKSVGCFAMTNDKIEEIYAFVREALDSGQERVPVHVFPFRMTAANLTRHANHAAAASWGPLMEAYNDFWKSQLPPRIALCSKRYVVNPVWTSAGEAENDPENTCPESVGKLLAPLSRKLAKKLKGDPLVAEGPKMRSVDDIANWDSSIAKAAVADAEKREQDRKLRMDANSATPAGTNGVAPFLNQ